MPSGWAIDCAVGTRKTISHSARFPAIWILEDHTDYRVAMFPIGGYVKIAGMIDESMDTEFLSHDPRPWEFRAKPIWQRAIVMCAGVAMNVLLAICIFWGIIYYNGKMVRPITEIGYVAANSAASTCRIAGRR